MCNQTPDFDALSRLEVSIRGVLERRVQRPAGHGLVRVETLDEQHVPRRHAVLVVPPVVWTVAHDPRLAHEAVLGHLSPDQVGVGDGRRVCHRNGILEDRPDRPPHVDDLVPSFEHLVGLIGKLPAQSPLRALVVKAQMVPLRRPASHLVVEDVDGLRARHVLDELLALWVVGGPYLLVVGEQLLPALVAAVLEPLAVERVVGLVAADIGNDKVVSLDSAHVLAPLHDAIAGPFPGINTSQLPDDHMECDGFILVPRPGDERDTPSEAQPTFLSEIDDFVCALQHSLWPLNCYIHNNPELGYNEHKAHDALTSFMRSQRGWHVTPSAYGMETAWTAVYDSGRPGPVVAFNAEMGLASAEIVRSHHLGGKVTIVGTPAEEGGGGKIKCLEAGAYKGVDVSIISHPGILNNSPMVRTTAFTHLNIAYHGRAAHAANSPWRGINALDAMVVAYGAISALRQQTRPDDVIGLQITNGGNKPNVIHEHAAGVAVLRAVSAARLRELQRKVEACFRAGAEATGATVDIDVVPGYMDHVPNRVLAASYAKYWQALPDIPDPPLPVPGQVTWVKASTDQGNISYALPSMNVSFAIPPGVEKGQPHSPDFERASSKRGAFDRAMRVAKAMAGTAVDVLATPGLLHEVREQWRRDMAEHARS
ncbi:peptidase M20 domain-containing 2 [Purpureocillium lavendulum]|uniref:Peptidase M20 domain-containing 2 n=1 Tax=Purpureocillium lavendulum TaxID=1247861 RepID=A0AB34FKD8_9HYPO|nr:peptidase M20 domain-containing 2 [Purpureocillium lavendulum]